MKLTAFAPGDTKTFVPLLCPTWLCQNVLSMQSLLDAMDAKAAERPGARILATLDDAGQAFYTSGHTIDANELDPALESNQEDSALPDFAARRKRLLQAAEGVTIAQLRNRLWWSGESHPSFLLLHDRPDTLLDRNETYIQAVPVDHAWETIAAFPNGYFQGDLSPMENLVLARHLEETFGYALFGIGASYLGFRRASPRSGDQLGDLAAFIVDLHAESNEPDLAARIRMTLAATDLLFLRYVDS